MDNRAYPPIWQRFPATFLYGFHKYPLGLSVGIGLIFALLQPGFIISILLIFMGTKYAVEVFRKTLAGNLEPPPLNTSALIENYGPAVQIYLLMILLGILVAAIESAAGPIIGMIAGYFFLISLPACFMVLMITESMLQAVNPVMLVQMMTRMGWSYVILYGLLFVLTSAWTNLSMLVAEVSNPFLLIFGMYTVMFYFSVVAAHMMGYMVLQEGEALGTGVPPDPDEDTRLALFDSLLAQGKNEAARLELAGLIESHPNDLDLQKRMHNLALADQAAKDLLNNALRYIPRLMDAGKLRHAVDIYLDCMQVAPTTPLRLPPQHTCALANALRGMGKPKPAFQLLKGFHKTFPNSEHTLDAYLLGAKILCEDLNREDLARQMLQYLLQTFPHHERQGEVRGYLQSIAALGNA